MKEYINRRIWHVELGLCYFCSICGEYKPEADFYKSKRSKWGVEPRCKLHFTRKVEGEEEGKHLKLQRVTEEDFVGARKLLNLLGYETSGTTSVYQQFINKHKLKLGK